MNDKLKHFIAGFILSIGGIIWTPVYAFGFIAGAAKEIFDQRSKKYGTPDAFDCLATWAGAGCAVMIGVLT